MDSNKLSPVIIGVLLLVVLAIGVLIFATFTSDEGKIKDGDKPGTSEESIKPVIHLNKEFEGDKPRTVKIIAMASTTDPAGIKEIILPDGSSMAGDKAEYVVDKNDVYKFEVISVNGDSDSLTIDVTEISEISATNPYVPDGFEVINDDVNSGFVIEDETGNQFVWIPVESGKLSRETNLDYKYEEKTSSASGLVNSVAKYYGFYIGRYEASEYLKDGVSVAASIAGEVPWTNINYIDASNAANATSASFGYPEDIYTAIGNSYAWDTTLKWIDLEITNFSSSTNYGNYDGTILPTGKTDSDVAKNIFDLAGNVREWTTEIYNDNNKDKKDEDNSIQRVIRSGGANLKKTPGSHGGYKETSVSPYWGFRLIMYKK